MAVGQKHLALGRAGEDDAARYLRGLGWVLLDRNWRPTGPARQLELDIVASHSGRLVFVEVKTRRAPRPGQNSLRVPAHMALSTLKQARLVRAATLYLTENEAWRLPCRFDLICLEWGSGVAPLHLEHFTDVIEFGNLVDSGHTSWQPW